MMMHSVPPLIHRIDGDISIYNITVWTNLLEAINDITYMKPYSGQLITPTGHLESRVSLTGMEYNRTHREVCEDRRRETRKR
jgi:hypothetical protein